MMHRLLLQRVDERVRAKVLKDVVTSKVIQSQDELLDFFYCDKEGHEKKHCIAWKKIERGEKLEEG